MGAFKAFFDLFKQGKALVRSATWKNRTIGVNALASFLASAVVVAQGFSYDVQIDSETTQQMAAGVFAFVCAINAVMHVITSKKVGLPEVPPVSGTALQLDGAQPVEREPVAGGGYSAERGS